MSCSESQPASQLHDQRATAGLAMTRSRLLVRGRLSRTYSLRNRSWRCGKSTQKPSLPSRRAKQCDGYQSTHSKSRRCFCAMSPGPSRAPRLPPTAWAAEWWLLLGRSPRSRRCVNCAFQPSKGLSGIFGLSVSTDAQPLWQNMFFGTMCSESRLDSPSFIPETIYSIGKKPSIIIHALVLSVRYPNMGLPRHFSLLIHFAPMNFTESLIAS